jgi:hypothetical protein
MTYSEWCNSMELRYDTLPQWYYDPAKRRAEYEASVAHSAPNLTGIHPAMATALNLGLSVATVRALDSGLIGTEADEFADSVVSSTLETVMALAESDRDRALDAGDR